MAIREQQGRKRPFFVYWTNPITGKRESKSCATRQEAEKLDAYIKYQLQYERESFARPEIEETPAETLETLLYGYFRQRKLELPNLERSLYALKWIIGNYGSREAQKINSAMLTEMKERLTTLGNSGATVRRKLGIVRAALGWAFREGLIKEMPAFPVIECGDHARYMPPTQEEVAMIYDVAPEHLKRVLVLGFQFGLRVGQSELLRLRWEDIDFAIGIIRVPNAKKGAHTTFREVPIQNALVDLLSEWQRKDAERGLDVVIHYKGKPVKSIRRAWATALKMAGITRHIRPYDLRHGFATEAIAAGADYGTVANLMGHASPVMVLKHYQHIRNEQKKLAIEAMPTAIQCVQNDVCKQ